MSKIGVAKKVAAKAKVAPKAENDCPACRYGEMVGWPTCQKHDPRLQVGEKGQCSCPHMRKVYGPEAKCGVCLGTPAIRPVPYDPDESILRASARLREEKERKDKGETGENGVAVEKAPPKPRTELFGFPGTRVIRWMGANGYTLEQVAKVVEAYSLPLQASTQKLQFVSGTKGLDRNGKPDTPVPLSEENVRELRAVLGLDPAGEAEGKKGKKGKK